MAESTFLNEQKATSSWFNNFNLSTNIINPLSNLSSSILQATSKVGTAANTFVQKTIQQGSTTSNSNDEQTSNKNLSNILTDLGSTVMKNAQQLKQIVEEKSFFGNFNKEQEKFLTEKRTQQQREESAVPPWIGYKEEEQMKKQILELSKEKRNFLRNPPPGANFRFDMSLFYPIALATLEIDENLKQMRFDLVPKQINEETFWQNYFYRVSLIKQSTQLTTLTDENDKMKFQFQNNSSDINQDFVSEDCETSNVTLDEIRREIEQINTMKNKTKSTGSDFDESEWDKDLAEELENVTAEELEEQINQMLSVDSK